MYFCLDFLASLVSSIEFIHMRNLLLSSAFYFDLFCQFFHFVLNFADGFWDLLSVLHFVVAREYTNVTHKLSVSLVVSD